MTIWRRILRTAVVSHRLLPCPSACT